MSLNGLPVWVKAVATVGFPIVVATYLLGATTGAIPSALSQEHANMVQSQEQVRRDLQEQDKVRQEQAKEQKALLQLICINTAKDTTAATACLQLR